MQAFPIFCLRNRTALHAACIQGCQSPFETLLNNYEYKKEMNEKFTKKNTKNKNPIYMNSTPTKKVFTILYPYEYQIYKKEFESSFHFNSLSSKFKTYLTSHFFELIYPKTFVE